MTVYRKTITDGDHQIVVRTSEVQAPDYSCAIHIQTGAAAILFTAGAARELGQRLIEAADHYDARVEQ